MSILDKFKSGDPVALARIISHIENRGPETEKILAEIYPKTGRAHTVGITGPPGAGKSTIVDKLCALYLERGQTVGIIAVDPSSPFTGGALLGDRIRMQDLAVNPNVFIRSMATRGSTGGLALATTEVIRALDAFGKEFILVETVGVGQVELDVAEACDTTVVVLVPESGDSIQAMKAGLMEIADIFVVNKADREGAQRLVSELNMMVDVKRDKAGRDLPVVSTQATNNGGVAELLTKIDAEYERLKVGDNFKQHRKKMIRYDIIKTIEHRFKSRLLDEILPNEKLDQFVEKIYAGQGNPYDLAQKIIDNLK
ncbi:MAG TPA: methylmalonyl Co-A mutase-associated GTPase MeaB [candidate division Zixibacteria bacterium]|nr:methylmalonyl Co-A mutase-associated GTPase MeaB [candidate division Zixibacteria bacterium]